MMRVPIRVHPPEMILHRYAEGALRATTSVWVRRHLATCYECRASVCFTRSLREALASLPATIPMEQSLIDCVIADRRAGDRVVLPRADFDAAPAVRHHGMVRALAVVAAAILLLIGVSRTWRSSTRKGHGGSSRVLAGKSAASAEDFAVSEFFLPKSAFATQIVPSEPRVPPLTVDGARLRPLVVKYARFERAARGPRRQTGTESLELSLARIEGRDVWRAIQRRQVGDTMHVETVYADRATLRTLGRTIRVQPYMHYLGITVRQRLVGESLTGWMQTDSGLGRPIARQLSPAAEPYLSDAIAPVILSASTLGPEWRGRFSILGWAVRDGDVSFPALLRVTGEERITVPAGTFDCWRLAVEASIGMQTFWVRKSDGLGIRAMLEQNDIVRELVLIR